MTRKELSNYETGMLIRVYLTTGESVVCVYNKAKFLSYDEYNTMCYDYVESGVYLYAKDIEKPTKKDLINFLNQQEELYHRRISNILKQLENY